MTNTVTKEQLEVMAGKKLFGDPQHFEKSREKRKAVFQEWGNIFDEAARIEREVPHRCLTKSF